MRGFRMGEKLTLSVELACIPVRTTKWSPARSVNDCRPNAILTSSSLGWPGTVELDPIGYSRSQQMLIRVFKNQRSTGGPSTKYLTTFQGPGFSFARTFANLRISRSVAKNSCPASSIEDKALLWCLHRILAVNPEIPISFADFLHQGKPCTRTVSPTKSDLEIRCSRDCLSLQSPRRAAQHFGTFNSVLACVRCLTDLAPSHAQGSTRAVVALGCRPLDLQPVGLCVLVLEARRRDHTSAPYVGPIRTVRSCFHRWCWTQIFGGKWARTRITTRKPPLNGRRGQKPRSFEFLGADSYFATADSRLLF